MGGGGLWQGSAAATAVGSSLLSILSRHSSVLRLRLAPCSAFSTPIGCFALSPSLQVAERNRVWTGGAVRSFGWDVGAAIVLFSLLLLNGVLGRMDKDCNCGWALLYPVCSQRKNGART